MQLPHGYQGIQKHQQVRNTGEYHMNHGRKWKVDAFSGYSWIPYLSPRSTRSTSDNPGSNEKQDIGQEEDMDSPECFITAYRKES